VPPTIFAGAGTIGNSCNRRARVGDGERDPAPSTVVIEALTHMSPSVTADHAASGSASAQALALLATTAGERPELVRSLQTK
jgi:hypothetical protein